MQDCPSMWADGCGWLSSVQRRRLAHAFALSGAFVVVIGAFGRVACLVPLLVGALFVIIAMVGTARRSTSATTTAAIGRRREAEWMLW